jgi:hypothetical protein
MAEEAEVAEQPEETTSQEVDTAELEARAKRMGWKPAGEYDNRGKFMSAEEFIRKGEEDLPLLRARLHRMDDNYSRILSELSDQKQLFSDYREFTTRAEQRAYEKARRELTAKQEAAVAHADTETYKATAQEIAELDRHAAEDTARRAPQSAPKEAAQAAPPATQPRIDPVAQKWVDDNPWFLNDPQLNRAAKFLDDDLMKSAPGLSVAERLGTVKDEIKRMYPEKFKNPLREKASAVATPSAASGGRRKTGEKGYEDLPPEAKKACDKFLKNIPGYTVEQYIKDYDWE